MRKLGSWKILALATLAGTMMAFGGGSCLPYNYWSGFLGDTLIATFVGTIVAGVATAVTPTP